MRARAIDATFDADRRRVGERVAIQALYLAKREGKDRACTFPQLVTELELADGNLVSMLAEAGPQVMVAVAHAVDHRNPVSQGHSSRMATIAEAIGRRCGIVSGRLEDLRAAAFLHDVGHMSMTAEGDTFEAPGHAEAGEKIVSAAQFPAEVAAAVGHHHERWDGSGSAGAMAGDKIPIMARILAACERYEALTAGRGCLRLSPVAAMEKMTEGSGTEFDPAVVEALGRAVRDGNLELNLPDLALPASAFTNAPALEPALP